MKSTTLHIRVIGAIGATVAAFAHFSLYRAGYSDVPVANIGAQFLLNAVAGIVIAVALVGTATSRVPHWATRFAASSGIAWAAMSLVAYTLSHSDRGWMGYRDGPAFFAPSPEGAMSVFGEAAVLVACVMLLAVGRGRRIRRDRAR